ncbi:MAG TPA: hypothetical protein GX707_15610, partial [Epulopiscium sp.]|nr:hypothetical protein [Candidatus Epulonipiscium sp.]
DTVYTFRNNILYNENQGVKATASVGTVQDGCVSGYILKGNSSFGNNIDALNNK